MSRSLPGFPVLCHFLQWSGWAGRWRLAVLAAAMSLAGTADAAPVITSIAPTSASTAGGVTMIISGSSLGTSTPTVMIGSAPAPVTSWNNSQISCTVPEGEGSSLPVVVTVLGEPSNSVNFSYDAPSISSISPAASGPTAGGTTVTLTGSSFGLSPVVRFNGLSVTPLASSHNTIHFLLPAGQGTGNTVQVVAGGQSSNVLTFSYSAPVITSINPSQAATAGGAAMTISGTNFGATLPSVTIGGAEATVTTHSHTSIGCMVPAGEGTGKPVVVTAGGQSSNAVFFSYTAPFISGISPNHGPAGTPVTLNGSSFGLNSSVTIGGIAAPVISRTHNQITCTVPEGTGFSRPVVVSVAGQLSNQVAFSYDPRITSISPAIGPTAGGTTLVITGTDLATSTPLVTIGGRPATGITILSSTQIQCITPAGEGTDLPVVVTVLGNSSNTVLFDYQAPVISSVVPATGFTAGGTTVTLTGSSFGLSPVVRFNGLPVTPLASSHNTIHFLLPAGQGTGNTVQVVAGGQPSNVVAFSYSAPSIASISPSQAATAGGTNMTISGTNFGVTLPSVTIGGTEATVTTRSQTSIGCVIPAGEGTGKPVVVTVGGQSSNAFSFNYTAPSIAGISPGHGPAGTTVTLNGTSFGLNPSVTIGGIAAPVTSRTHSQITCTVPDGSGFSRPVIVTVAGQSSNQASFSYDPRITSVSPANGPTAGGTTLVITGTDLATSTPAVTIGGRPATGVSILSPTQIQCTTPAGEGADLPVVATVLGNPSNAVPFDYLGPFITLVFPATGPTAGGTTVTLQGSDFGLNPVVYFDGVPVTPVASSHMALHFLLPAGQGMGRSIMVNAAGQVSNTVFFSYAAPVLSSVTPGNGPTAGGMDVTLTGSNFGTALPSVTVGSSSAIITTFSQTMIQFKTPSGQGTQPVRVTVAGQISNALNFAYDAPSITALSVNNGPTAGGTAVTISGSNFGLTPAVTVGGAPAPVLSSTHTAISVSTPAGAGLNRPVRVTVAGQQSNAASFHYHAPVVTAVTPDHATTAGGTLLAISGLNFSTTASATALVTVGGTTSTLVSQEETTVTILCPPGTGPRKSVIVTVAGQSNAPNELFSYDPVEEVLLAPPGDAPPTSYTEVRAVIDFEDGNGTNPDGSSDTTVTIVRNNEELRNVPGEQVSEVFWQLETNRTFTEATILFQYKEQEVSNLREEQMVLYTSESPDGPWSPVPNQILDTGQNLVGGTVSHFSFFTLAGPTVPVTLSGFAVE